MRAIPGRYNTDGPWFKGNTHIHTTRSDGGKDYAAVASMYAEKGYDFLFVTDHGVVADIEGMPDLPLLALNGVEIGGTDETGAWFHAVALGCSEPLPPDSSFAEQLAHVRAAGAVVALAHPCWTGNSVEDALRHGFDGVEIYNHICHYLNGKSLSTYHWDCMLEANARCLGLCADDAHLNGAEPWDGGWIVVAARELTRWAVLESIRAGNFYSTQGPRFECIRAEADTVYLRTSPVRAIRLTDNTCWGTRVYAEAGTELCEAEFRLTGERLYVRAEIEDALGRRAWTNAILEADRG